LETGGGGECENKRERQEEEPKFTVIFFFPFKKRKFDERKEGVREGGFCFLA